MKLVRNLFATILLLFLLFVGAAEALAANAGFAFELLPENDMDTMLKNVSITMLTDEPPKKAIECFAVNEDGMIAIGCSSSENKKVCIYSSDGVFQYGYSFNCSGKFGIDLDKNILNIYLVRSDVAIAVDSSGKINSALKIQKTPGNDAYWSDCVFSTRRRVGDFEYSLENDMGILNIFASSYSRLVITNKYGEERTIYDVNPAQLTKMVVAAVGVIVFVCLIAMVIIRQFIKQKAFKGYEAGPN